ncbi:MAG: proton-conducting transporter membrane subunit [Planctomycetaceae bacterium]
MINGFSTNMLVIAMALVPLGPLAAFALTAVGGRFLTGPRGLWLASIGGALSLVASLAATLLLTTAESPGDSFHTVVIVELFRWLSLSDEPSSVVRFGLQLDGLSGVILVAVTAAVTAVTVHAAFDRRDPGAQRSLAIGISAMTASTVMALLAPNFVQFFIFWQLAGVCGWWLRDRGDAPVMGSDFLIHRATDSFLLFGVLLVWATFDTSDFTAIAGNQSSPSPLLAAFLEADGNLELQTQRTAVVATICLCLLVGVIGRCQQFPLFGKLGERAPASPAIDGLVQAAIFIPLGVFLLARCRPLFAVAVEASRLTAMLGGLTALLAAACALTQRDLQRLLRFVAAALCGWILIGFGSGTTAGFLAATLLLVVLIAAVSSLFLIAEQIAARADGTTDFTALGGLRHAMPVPYWSFLLAILVLTSGLWGQNAILSALDTPSALAPDSIEQPDASPLVGALLPGIAAASLLLTGFALFRGFFLTFHHGPQRADAVRDRPTTSRQDDTAVLSSGTIVLVMAISAALLGPAVAGYGQQFANLLGSDVAPAGAAQQTDLFFVDYGSLLALTGAVAAWMMYAQRTQWPDRVAGALAPFVRLSENRFYLDQVGEVLLVLPARGLAHLCRFLDWLVIERFWKSAPARLFAELQRAARPLQTGLVQFYALSLCLASVILLAVVLWLKG